VTSNLHDASEGAFVDYGFNECLIAWRVDTKIRRVHVFLR
jgi:hypothetical protein